MFQLPYDAPGMEEGSGLLAAIDTLHGEVTGSALGLSLDDLVDIHDWLKERIKAFFFMPPKTPYECGVYFLLFAAIAEGDAYFESVAAAEGA